MQLFEVYLLGYYPQFELMDHIDYKTVSGYPRDVFENIYLVLKKLYRYWA
jgi:hypothetical protein